MMADYQIPEAPGIEQAYRAAHRALEGIAPAGSYVPEAELPVSEVMSQFGALVRQAEVAAAAQLWACGLVESVTSECWVGSAHIRC